MRVLLQRVQEASVTVSGQVVGSIGLGYLLLVGIGAGDEEATADTLAEKLVNLRLFPDELGRFDRSLLEVGGGALVVSQFTLWADCKKGRRPSFSSAARPELAEPLCDYFARKLEALGVSRVQTGVFGAHMDVALLNDGPVTVWLDSDAL